MTNTGSAPETAARLFELERGTIVVYNTNSRKDIYECHDCSANQIAPAAIYMADNDARKAQESEETMSIVRGKLLRILMFAGLVVSGLGLATIVCGCLLEGGSNWFARHLDNDVLSPIGALMIMVGIPSALVFRMLGSKYRDQEATAKFASWLQQMRNLTVSERCLMGKSPPSRDNSIVQIVIGVALILTPFLLRGVPFVFIWIGSAFGIRGVIHLGRSSPHRCPHCNSGLQNLAKVPVRVSDGPVFLCTTCGTIWLPARAASVEVSPWWPLNTGMFGVLGGLLASATGPALKNKQGTPAVILVKGSDVNAKNENGTTPLHITPQTVSGEADERLERALNLEAKAQYQEAVQEYDRIVQEFPNSSQAVEASKYVASLRSRMDA